MKVDRTRLKDEAYLRVRVVSRLEANVLNAHLLEEHPHEAYI